MLPAIFMASNRGFDIADIVTYVKFLK